MCDTYLGLQSANKKGQNVGLVFSKSPEGSKSKHPLSKRLQLTDTLRYPIFWESWPRWHIRTIYQSAKRDGSVSPGEWVSSPGTEHSHEGSWSLRGILQTPRQFCSCSCFCFRQLQQKPTIKLGTGKGKESTSPAELIHEKAWYAQQWLSLRGQ